MTQTQLAKSANGTSDSLTDLVVTLLWKLNSIQGL